MALTEILRPAPLPLRQDDGGIIRVGGTRVRLDTVVWAYNHGATPDEIVSDYPSLKLADVHAVISYYLNNRPDVDAYLHERQSASDEARRSAEEIWPPDGVMERLRSRQPKKSSTR